MSFTQAVSQFFQSVWEVFSGTVMSFRWNDLLDILVMAFLIYKAIQLLRDTRASQLLKGIFLLCVALAFSSLLNLKTLNLLLTNVFNFGLVAIVVLFQPELRRALERVGRTRMGKIHLFQTTTPEERSIQKMTQDLIFISEACESMSHTKTGALIVFERESILDEQIATGVQLNADISRELIGNIFFKNSPLHDGAVIIRNSRILAASCFLPKPEKEDQISRELGSRHRAAIGMSENSDAIIVVVSEETGTISVAEGGHLIRDLNRQGLLYYLTERLVPDPPEKKQRKRLGRSKEK